MTEPVDAESVTDVTRRFILPGIEELLGATNIFTYKKLSPAEEVAWLKKQEMLHAALFNVGATYEDADQIGLAHYYGKYGGDD